mmetsp:Transcript_29324/g.44171  ORF Transcript_29324/g.44171 Transcript_29324/m.44171 type:complete len:96 (-) Transcript_29324:2389-2676(-)
MLRDSFAKEEPMLLVSKIGKSSLLLLFPCCANGRRLLLEVRYLEIGVSHSMRRLLVWRPLEDAPRLLGKAIADEVLVLEGRLRSNPTFWVLHQKP